ncbi:hypothetical protein BD408DRAFT_413735 [Parasitella parasitica]|nr:hypothetical protein BD408DRAFT_413735 [Parasitella parasitica]
MTLKPSSTPLMIHIPQIKKLIRLDHNRRLHLKLSQTSTKIKTTIKKNLAMPVMINIWMLFQIFLSKSLIMKSHQLKCSIIHSLMTVMTVTTATTMKTKNYAMPTRIKKIAMLRIQRSAFRSPRTTKSAKRNTAMPTIWKHLAALLPQTMDPNYLPWLQRNTPH